MKQNTTTPLTTLNPSQLSKTIDAHNLPASSKRVKPIHYFLGQQRVEQALDLALNMQYSGYNLCVIGQYGLAKDEQILNYLYDKYSHKQYSKQNTPIIYEQYPTLNRLFGEIYINKNNEFLGVEYGALQKANNGILILDLAKVLQQTSAWDLLKHALKTNVWQWNTLPKESSIRIPIDDIPLNLKVILLAEADLYDDLFSIDPELMQLFKIRTDFNEQLIRTHTHEQAYISWICHFIQHYNLLPFNRHAFAEILNDASRQAESQHHLSLDAHHLSTILQQAHAYAKQQSINIVDAHHVRLALTQHAEQIRYWRELYWQEITQGTLLITTQGYRLGQVNALSVIEYNHHEFGFPSRLTATVSQGAGDILDIERSVDLGGALHAKGTLLMSSFLKSHFGRQYTLNFSAAIAFEQSYGEIDGDSATVAELCALISAIGQIPINQAWAITGSMNQLGQVQPVGGINAKIEGFFDVCKLQGLTGEQGVIIPRQNTQHLMLRSEIIQAVADRHFHIHAIDNIEQALTLLMNRPIGIPDKKGIYPNGSIYQAIIEQLEQWHQVENSPLFDESNKKKKKKAQ